MWLYYELRGWNAGEETPRVQSQAVQVLRTRSRVSARHRYFQGTTRYICDSLICACTWSLLSLGDNPRVFWEVHTLLPNDPKFSDCWATKGAPPKSASGQKHAHHASSNAHIPSLATFSTPYTLLFAFLPPKCWNVLLVTYTTSSFPLQSSLERRPITRIVELSSSEVPSKGPSSLPRQVFRKSH